jgi:hypothetical protein
MNENLRRPRGRRGVSRRQGPSPHPEPQEGHPHRRARHRRAKGPALGRFRRRFPRERRALVPKAIPDSFSPISGMGLPMGRCLQRDDLHPGACALLGARRRRTSAPLASGRGRRRGTVEDSREPSAGRLGRLGRDAGPHARYPDLPKRAGGSAPEPKHPQSDCLGAVVGQFKGEATKRIRSHLRQPDFAWQPRFHDVILRTPADLERVRAYIRDNPKNWIP